MVQRVGDHRGGAEGGQPLRNQVPGLGQPVPLLALALDAVHVERHGHAEEARPEREDGVGAIAVERRIHAVRQQVQGGDEGVRQGVEVLVADGGQVVQAHAAVAASRMPLAAIDGDLVPARRQARGKLFGEGLEAAVTGRNAARAENGDAHRRRRRPTSCAVSERESRRDHLLGRPLAHRRVLEPARHVLVVHAPAGLDQAALGHHPLQVPRPGTRRP